MDPIITFFNHFLTMSALLFRSISRTQNMETGTGHLFLNSPDIMPENVAESRLKHRALTDEVVSLVWLYRPCLCQSWDLDSIASSPDPTINNPFSSLWNILGDSPVNFQNPNILFHNIRDLNILSCTDRVRYEVSHPYQILSTSQSTLEFECAFLLVVRSWNVGVIFEQ